jgi:nucleoid-associated protein YgaU
VSTNMGNLEKLGILVIVILVVVVGVVAITPKSTVDERLMPEVAQAAVASGIEPLDPTADPSKAPVDPFPGAEVDASGLPAKSLDPASAPAAGAEEFRIVKAQANDTFATIAKRELTTAARFTEIAKLNPDLNGAKLKKGQDVKIPLAPAAVPALGGAAPGAESASAPPSPASAERTYTVRSGDTLSSIAQTQMKSKNKWRDLQKANEDVLHGSTNLKIGMKLKIPGTTSTSATSSDVAAPAAPPTAAAAGDREYVVKSGDSLWSIAKNQLGSDKYVSALREANSDVLKGGDDLKIGMKLRLPATH